MKVRFLPLFLMMILFSCVTKNSETSGIDTVAVEDSIDVQTALTADGPELEIEEEVTSPAGTDDMLYASNESEVRAGMNNGGRLNSALLYACINHNLKLVNDLLVGGADKGVALFWAVEFEDMEITKALIDQGARMENSVLEEMRYLVYTMQRDDLKEHWTEVGGCSKIAYSNNEALKALGQNSIKGKMYSEVWEDGESPGRANSELIRASALGQASAVEFMIKAGANPNAYTPYCNSALGEAEQNGHAAVVEVLKKYDAKKQEGC